MSRPIVVQFPGGLAVDATVSGHLVHTDQPEAVGGGGTGPTPFALFLGSLATCAGYFALQFCKQRGLPTEGLGVSLRPDWNPATHRLDRIDVDLTLPDGFPEKYRPAIVRAVDQCSVKRHMIEPPEMAVTVAETDVLASV